jgi:hypothetical protein
MFVPCFTDWRKRASRNSMLDNFELCPPCQVGELLAALIESALM